ncbi:hypothetical protein AVEN_76268-1 [Araneus ventricosus]|uniref:Uncharacterized protein n=1 Tax=Araneus ventricosus TaxID=182803 RepID=A0A4Y2I908_ARAVE|nr:hypothetical protein AVEN_76268-1 [Araneus ventricosus]
MNRTTPVTETWHNLLAAYCYPHFWKPNEFIMRACNVPNNVPNSEPSNLRRAYIHQDYRNGTVNIEKKDFQWNSPHKSWRRSHTVSAAILGETAFYSIELAGILACS